MPRELAKEIPTIKPDTSQKDDLKVYSHLFGVIGDWYICAVSEDCKTAFGYQDIYSEQEWEMDEWFKNKKGWGTFSIEKLQTLVNDEFLKEKDIRFLICRDLHWEATKFSDLNLEKQTLNYPGN